MASAQTQEIFSAEPGASLASMPEVTDQQTGQSGISDLFSELFSARRSQGTRTPVPSGVEIWNTISRFPSSTPSKARKPESRITVKTAVPAARVEVETRKVGVPALAVKAAVKSTRLAEVSASKWPVRPVIQEDEFAVANCPRCSGEGTVRDQGTVTVGIPAGVDSGSRVRISEKGNAGRFGGASGDLYLIVNVESHSYFRRRGNDILTRVPLTITEAALGTEIVVPTVRKGKLDSRFRQAPRAARNFGSGGEEPLHSSESNEGINWSRLRWYCQRFTTSVPKSCCGNSPASHPENPRDTSSS